MPVYPGAHISDLTATGRRHPTRTRARSVKIAPCMDFGSNNPPGGPNYDEHELCRHLRETGPHTRTATINPMSCPTTAAFVTPRPLTSARIRLAAWAMSRPSLGMPESPMPGRSGAMTVKRAASVRIKGRHMRDVSAFLMCRALTSRTASYGAMPSICERSTPWRLSNVAMCERPRAGRDFR
jgi:hypothetical protein